MKKCPNCKTEMTVWDGETPNLKIPCTYSYCSNCGTVCYPEIKATMKLIPNDKKNHGILSFTK